MQETVVDLKRFQREQKNMCGTWLGSDSSKINTKIHVCDHEGVLTAVRAPRLHVTFANLFLGMISDSEVM